MHRSCSATRIAALLLALPLGLLAAHAQQQDAHVHGHLTLNVVVQDTLLVVEMAAPAANVVGFEHVPRTDAERNKLAAQLDWLRSGRAAIGVPRAAGCRLERVDVSSPDWGVAHADHEHAGDEHAEFRATWRFRCASPAALAWFEPWLLRRLLAVEEVDVNLVNGSLQRRAEATVADQRIALR